MYSKFIRTELFKLALLRHINFTTYEPGVMYKSSAFNLLPCIIDRSRLETFMRPLVPSHRQPSNPCCNGRHDAKPFSSVPVTWPSRHSFVFSTPEKDRRLLPNKRESLAFIWLFLFGLLVCAWVLMTCDRLNNKNKIIKWKGKQKSLRMKLRGFHK